MEIKDKVCLVTGGTKGIGAAVAVELAEKGADVAIVGRHYDSETETVRASIKQLGRNCEYIKADCSIPAEATRSVQDTIDKFGAIDVLVHSAGGPANGNLLEISAQEWMAAFDIHIHAIFHLCRASIPVMQKNSGGAVVLISSVAGIRGIPKNIAYQTVKGAVPQMTRALAYEFAESKVRVNCVAPGIIRTRFHANMSVEQQRHNLNHRIPLKQEGSSQQVASLIRELIQNDYITGETVVIDGGLTMRIA
jgi:NAD(P)-dependent dehydrogenase (short-subunit alcohol dehydrogenase family)